MLMRPALVVCYHAMTFQRNALHKDNVPTTMSEESLGWILMLMRPALGASRYVPEAMKALQALSELPATYKQFTLGLHEASVLRVSESRVNLKP